MRIAVMVDRILKLKNPAPAGFDRDAFVKAERVFEEYCAGRTL
jgi:hypothetical protein